MAYSGTVCTTFPEACVLPASEPSTEGDAVAPRGKADAAALSHLDHGVMCLLQAEMKPMKVEDFFAGTSQGSIASAVQSLNATARARPPYLPTSALARTEVDVSQGGSGSRSGDEAQLLEAAEGGLPQPTAFTDTKLGAVVPALLHRTTGTSQGSIASAVQSLNATARARPPYLPTSALARAEMDVSPGRSGSRSGDEAQLLEAAEGGLPQPTALTDTKLGAVVSALLHRTNATHSHEVDAKQSLNDTDWKILCCIVVVLFFVGHVVTTVVSRIFSRVVGRFIEAGIEHGAPFVLGVAVSLDSLSVDVFHGKVTISNMTVHNPKKAKPYKSPYLFHAGKVIVDMNMKTLLLSNFETIEVEELVFVDVTATYDQPELLSTKSNVHDVMDYLNSGGNKEEVAVNEDEEAKEQSNEDANEQSDGDGGSLILHRLIIEDVGAEAIIKGKHISLELPPIVSEDFQKECSCTKTAEVVKALVFKVLRGMIDSAMPHFPKGSSRCVAS